MNPRIKELIEELKLEAHPEGGFYRETYRSEEMTIGDRNLMTAIYFLLTAENVSHFHRIKSDELWFFHEGDPLVIHTLDIRGHTEHILGCDFSKGYLPQFLVPKNTIFGSSMLNGSGYALVSCVVAPGFDFSDFELLSKADLLNEYPLHQEIIERLGI